MKRSVIGGTVTLTGATITAEWDGGRGTETWTLEDTPWGRRESRENFEDMVERWNENEAEGR